MASSRCWRRIACIIMLHCVYIVWVVLLMVVIAGGAFVICVMVVALGLFCLHRWVQVLLLPFIISYIRPNCLYVVKLKKTCVCVHLDLVAIISWPTIVALNFSCNLIGTRKPCYRKENRAMRPVYGCPEKFSGVPGYAHGYFSRNC